MLEEAKKWIVDPERKPLQPRKLYKKGVPTWMQLAIEQGLVEPNSAWRYTVTVLDGAPISVEKELDEALALKLANWQPHMSC